MHPYDQSVSRNNYLKREKAITAMRDIKRME